MTHAPTLSQNLRRLREAQELSQAAVAELAHISRVAYGSIEAGHANPKLDTLTKIAKALGVTPGQLMTPVPTLSAVRFRARKAMTSREQVMADVARWLDDYSQLERILGERQTFALEKLAKAFAEKKSPKRARDAAAEVRAALKLGPNESIRDICGLLEERCGVKVYPLPLASDLFFGLSIGRGHGGPAIAVNTWERIPVERWIFTAAHELAHLVLHMSAFDIEEKAEDDDEEHEADQFASHFLMPEKVFSEEWNEARGLALVDRVLKVKRIFKVSYRTVLYRLSEREVYGPDIWKRFQIDYKVRFGHGLKKSDEPRALTPSAFQMVENRAPDEPRRLDEGDFVEDRLHALVRRAVEDRLIPVSRAAEILRVDLDTMNERCAAWVD